MIYQKRNKMKQVFNMNDYVLIQLALSTRIEFVEKTFINDPNTTLKEIYIKEVEDLKLLQDKMKTILFA